MRPIIFILLLSAAVPLFAQIGAKAQQGKVHGLWQNSQFGYQMTLILNPDGSGEFDGEPIKFTTQGSKLSIAMGGATTDYQYTLQGNSLALSGGDLDGQVVFSRSADSSAAPDGSAQGAGTQAFSNTDKNLIGLWSGNGEMIDFRGDGTCVYQGNTFRYQISQGHIILQTPQGNATFLYSIKGTVLTLTANGQSVVYNRVPGSAKPGAAAVTPQASGGGVPMELVGQWCYLNMNLNSQTSRCITLNADGTYIYSFESSRSVNTNELYGATSSQNGDRGTWYVQGERIYYNSQTQGQGSYRLEKRNHPKNVNDPMIVLDGEAFVTTTARQPWRY